MYAYYKFPMAAIGNEKKYVGTCEHMCPIGELRMREARGLLHKFEISDKPPPRGRGRARNGRISRADPKKIVKEFTRPAAGKPDPEPWELRTVDSLRNTVSYLLSEVSQRTDAPWHIVYEYIFDRLRAIRQELVIQRIEDEPAIIILERIVCFLLYANYRLCTERIENFDPKICESHLQECLKWLLCLYQDSAYACREGEFVSLYLLFNMGSTEAIRLGLERKTHLRNESLFEKALSINLCWIKRNYVRFFRLVRDLPVLHKYAVHRHIAHIHREALQIMSSGYSSNSLNYPLPLLRDLLCSDSTEDAQNLCSLYCLTVKDNNVQLSKKAFMEPQEKVAPKHYRFIDTDFENCSLPSLLPGSNCSCSDT